jgi:carboxymethylenebutenolidase
MKMSDGAEIGAYHCEPTGARRGGLVLIQEIFGINPHIRDVSDSFAAEGYEVLAPSLFDREAPGFVSDYSPDTFKEALTLSRERHPFDLSIADAQACIDALKAKGPVFMTGYCYGGSVTWAAACKCEGLAAASGYYGTYIVTKMMDWQPKHPVILHFGNFDKSIPPSEVEKLKALHPEVPIYQYDADHGFNSDRHHDEASAKLAKARTLELFRKYGG